MDIQPKQGKIVVNSSSLLFFPENENIQIYIETGCMAVSIFGMLGVLENLKLECGQMDFTWQISNSCVLIWVHKVGHDFIWWRTSQNVAELVKGFIERVHSSFVEKVLTKFFNDLKMGEIQYGRVFNVEEYLTFGFDADQYQCPVNKNKKKQKI